MAEAVDAIASTVRAGGTIMVHGDYDVDGQCATALLTRALRAAGADVVGFVPHRLRDGYDFGPAGLAAAQAARRVAGHHLRLRDHGRRHGPRRAGGRDRRGRHRPPPARRRAAAGASPSSIRSAPTTPRTPDRSAAPASPSSWCRRWCPRSGCRRICRITCSTWWPSPPWPTWCPLHGREPHPGAATGSGCSRESRVAGAPGTGRGQPVSAGREIRAGHWATFWARGSTRPAGSATRPTASACC